MKYQTSVFSLQYKSGNHTSGFYKVWISQFNLLEWISLIYFHSLFIFSSLQRDFYERGAICAPQSEQEWAVRPHTSIKFFTEKEKKWKTSHIHVHKMSLTFCTKNICECWSLRKKANSIWLIGTCHFMRIKSSTQNIGERIWTMCTTIVDAIILKGKNRMN